MLSISQFNCSSDVYGYVYVCVAWESLKLIFCGKRKRFVYSPTQSSETYNLNSKQLFYVEELRREGVWVVLESKPAGSLHPTPCLPACPVFIKKYKWRLQIGRIACMPCQMLQLKHSLIRSNNQISVPHLPNPLSLQMSNL